MKNHVSCFRSISRAGEFRVQTNSTVGKFQFVYVFCHLFWELLLISSPGQ